jgi:hypothetical protein
VASVKIAVVWDVVSCFWLTATKLHDVTPQKAVIYVCVSLNTIFYCCGGEEVL